MEKEACLELISRCSFTLSSEYIPSTVMPALASLPPLSALTVCMYVMYNCMYV